MPSKTDTLTDTLDDEKDNVVDEPELLITEEEFAAARVPYAATRPLPQGITQLFGVRFQTAGRPYHFTAPPGMPVKRNAWVVVETIYGEQVGQVVEITDKLPEGASRELKPIARLASGLDMARHQLMLNRATQMLPVVTEEIRALRLELKVVSIEFALDGSSALVLCSGTLNKKDLPLLRRHLNTGLGCRVEVRSVGPREHAKALCGYGVCGEPRCCSRFLADFDAVSIRMAKDQGVSMAPTDITGMCGRLRCCLAYEHEVYREASTHLPKLKARVRTPKGVGRVIDLDILKGDLVVEIPPDGPREERERFRFNATEVEVLAATEASGGDKPPAAQ